MGSLMMLSLSLNAQEMKKDLASFEKIIVSPKINLVLAKGDHENIRLVYDNVSLSQINVLITGKTLHLFLDHARVVDTRKKIYHNNHTSRVSIYQNANITAYVTYRDLKRLEVRGEEEVTCDSLIAGEKFKLKAYGEAEITLAKVTADKFKASLYGRNKVRINAGATEQQTFRLFGENRIDTRMMESVNASSRIYGEGRLAITATNRFHLTSFGEPYVEVNGLPEIRKGIMIGRTHLNVK